MFAAVRFLALPMAVAVLAVAGSAGAAEAGWVTVRNDTARVVVVQGTYTCNGQVKRCKPVRLLPGETVREYHSAPVLRVEVFDGQTQNRALYTGNLAITPESQAFAIGTDGRAVFVTTAAGK
jgi:hypothetical protein